MFGGEIYRHPLWNRAPTRSAWNKIGSSQDKPQILCATHEPICGRLAAFLLNTPALRIEVKKGTLIRTVAVNSLGPKPHGVLKWMIVPKLA